jgi:transcriptional regulator with AAA-type ATPase domain
MNQAEKVVWLREQTSLSTLSDGVLEAMAAAMQEESVQENRRLVLEDTVPEALYILKSGRMESYRTSKTGLANAVSLLPGSILHLKELSLEQPAEQTVITLTDCVVWTIAKADFLAIVQQYPELTQTLSRQLATALDEVSAQLTYERERQTALRPYLVPKVRRGIVGTSRYATRLRQEIKKAANDRRSVLVFGEPGLGKDNATALIHFGSRYRQEPMIKIDCDTLQTSGSELFGRVGGKPGLLEWLGEGTLLLNNVQELTPDLQSKLVRLLETGEYEPIGREGEPPPAPRESQARLVMTSEKVLPALERKKLVGHIIRVPPLRVRKADILSQVEYYLSLYCRARGIAKPTVTPEALRRLQGYDFPGNLTELESLVERALLQSNGACRSYRGSVLGSQR